MGIEERGDQLLFYVKALAWTPRAIRRYKREILNILAEVAFGVGGLSVIAGTVGVIAFMAFFAGTEVGIQGYASLSQIGVAKFTAFISAYFNTREVAPLVSVDRAGRHRGLRLHRAPRRDADLRGDRRARGDGGPVAAVPGDHPDDRRRSSPSSRSTSWRCARRTSRRG